MATIFLPVSIKNPQILTITCCTHRNVPRYMLKKPTRILRLRRLCSDNSVSSSKATEMCQVFENVAILPLLYKRALSVPKRSIASRHCKRRLRKRIREFHSPLFFSSIILPSKTSSSRILNYSRTTPKLPISSLNPTHLIQMRQRYK